MKNAYQLPEKQTVLIVEDEPQVLNMAEMILKENGYEVLKATTPNKAIDLARQNQGRIQLLLTDVIMPEMDGEELSKQINGFEADINTLFMTGYSDDEIAEKTNIKGNLIRKPFTVQELIEKIQEILR